MPAPYPIVFFPGVMGSRLYFENSNSYWDPDSTWRMTHWLPVWPFRSDDDNRLQLHAREPGFVLIDPLTNPPDADGVNRLGWGGVAWSYYDQFLLDLRSLAPSGWAFAVGYDSRQDIRWLGQYAADKLWKCLDATGAEKLLVATHSMGGLVVRAAFLSDANLAGRVARVVHVCQPTVGAVNLYRRLFTGMIPGLDGSWPFRFLLGNSRAGFVGNMSGQPGPLQLLPSAYFPTDAGGHWHTALDAGLLYRDLYPNHTSPPGLCDATLSLPAEALADLAQRVQDVMAFHAWLGAPADPQRLHPDTWLIYGIEYPTETRIGFQGVTPFPGVTPGGTARSQS